MASPESGAELGWQLAQASQELEEPSSGAGSGSSEARDSVSEGRRVQDELERLSHTSSASSRRRRQQELVGQAGSVDDDAGSESERSDGTLGTSNSVKAMYRGVAAGAGPSPALSSSAVPLTTPIMDQVELALLDAKRAALEKVKDSGSGASGSGSRSAVGSGSMESSSLPGSGGGAKAGVLIYQALPPDKKSLTDEVVTTVIEKTGQELAQMQLALDRQKEWALAEAREKAELEAKLANIKTRAAPKSTLEAALCATREKNIEIEDERDDLKDKLVGMQTLLDAKVERHMKEKEEFRGEKLRMEEELKKKTDSDKEKLQEALAMASKEVEKTKKQKIAVSSERDIIRRSEMLTKKVHEAELVALYSELAQAKVDLRKNEDDDDLAADMDESRKEKVLAKKLKEQRDNNKKLHQEFEKLRIEMLTTHQEKEDKLAELQAKVEVAHSLPGKTLIEHKSSRKTKGRGQSASAKLQSIDEEDDEIFSQASGVSGQVSSDCDGAGVGDLRDFDDYDETKVKLLKEKLADADAWYKHLNETKNAKEAEHQAKITRLLEQLQSVREEAKQSKGLALQLEMDKEEIEAEKQAEVANVTAKLLGQQLENVGKTPDHARMHELEQKVHAYTTEVLQHKEKMLAIEEEKRILNIRLKDTQRELESTEERHTRTIGRLSSRLRHYGEDVSEASPSRSDKELSAQISALEEERNILRNELECQQVTWHSMLENEQRQFAALNAKLREEQDLAEKDRELKTQVELSLQETRRQLATLRQTLAESEAKLAAETAKRAQPVVIQGGLLDLLRCPVRSRDAPERSLPAQPSSGVSCQAAVWQIMSTLNGVAALFCSDETLQIRDASKKAFTMWGSSTLRNSTLFKLVYDESMAMWLKRELETPEMPMLAGPGQESGFFVRDLGFVEFRSRLGSAFDASLMCVRMPGELQKPPIVVVIVQPAAEEQSRQQYPSQSAAPARSAHQRPMHRQGPASVASSVHSEDITANDSVSNVNAKW